MKTIYAEYSRGGAVLPLAIPLKAGESFEDGLARVAPIVRDALGIKPARDDDPRVWAGIKERSTGTAAPSSGRRSK